MRTPNYKILLASVLATVLLTGCASKFNPMNWFGGSREETLKTVDIPTKAEDLRDMIDQVIKLNIEKTGGGAIIHAVGLPPTQGFWDGELVAENDELPVKGVLTYSFRIHEPFGFEKVSTSTSREVVVGYFVSNHKLNGVKTIRVIGTRNARSARR